jgi:menaquinone-specific isochorismate synthase
LAVTHQSGLQDIFLKAFKKAHDTSDFVLASYVEKIEAIDPLLFFFTGKSLGFNHRTIWRDANTSAFFSGIGSVYTISINDQEDRFGQVEREWNHLLEKKISIADQMPPGTGPIIFGGFSFDPKKDRSPMWSSFSDALFTLPKFMLTQTANGVWLTTNIVLSPKDDKSVIFECFAEREQLLAANGKVMPQMTNHFEKIEEVNKAEWLRSVEKAATQIRAGELDKVVLARELRVHRRSNFNVEQILDRLNHEQSTSYLFAFTHNESTFLGASPERLVKREGDQLLSTCLAGSIARGRSAMEDDQLGEKLLKDEKNLHEHALVVRMIKDAVANCCTQLSVPNKPILYKVRDIQHLYTPIIGKIKDDVSILKVVERLHPTPALGGYPQGESIEKIREIEPFDRGWYAAPVGWIDEKGNGEFAVAIRSGLISGKAASLFAGCGIVGDSEPLLEYDETNMKFRPMISALGGTFDE